MTFKIEHATADDYDELLDTLNSAFKKPPEKSFLQALPVMWRRTDEAMRKHLIIRDGARIAAVVGVYPFTVFIGKHKLLFSTVGNVGTRPEYEGRGMMRALFTAAMEEARAIGTDVARLGGQRQRYNRYGFDIAAQQYSFNITRKNISAYFDGSFEPGTKYEPKLTFRPITADDTAALAFAQSLQTVAPIHVDRGDTRRFYDVLIAWQNVPYVAEDANGKMVGYVSASHDFTGLAEHFALTPELHFQMLLDWVTHHEDIPYVAFVNSPYDICLNRLLTKMADGWYISSPSRFMVMDFRKLAEAALDLRAELIAPAPKGRLILKIEGYGTLDFTDGTVSSTDAAPMMTLNHLAATRFLFGQLSPMSIADIPYEARTYASALFPLPLSWNNQDRV
ncbi:MAG: GNAT family N-acetyltransferase [Victivallales bacterium]|nr:GNAT family N-acetyltransferase [Victivallales bacterium]